MLQTQQFRTPSKHRVRTSVHPMHTHRTQMTSTPKELIRQLAKIEGSDAASADPRHRQVVIANGKRKAIVTYRRRPHRQLSSLRLPVMQVEVNFEGYTQPQARAFMVDFERRFLRMGA